MAATYPNPGVDLQTINDSQSPNPVSTSIGVIAGEFEQGPLGPHYITNTTQFLQLYGKPNPSVGFATYQALSFLAKSQQLWVNRVIGSGAAYAGVYLEEVGSSITLASSGTDSPQNVGFAPQTTSLGQIAYFYGLSPSVSANNLAIQIVSPNITIPVIQGVVISSSTGTTSLNVPQVEYVVAAVSSAGTTLASVAVSSAVNISNAQATINWGAVEGAVAYQVFGNTQGNLGLLATLPATSTTYVDNGSVTPSTQQPVSNFVASPFFTVNVYDTSVSSTVPVENYSCSLTTMTNSNGQQTELEQAINNYSSRINVINNTAALDTVPVIFSVGLTNMVGGNSGAAPTDGDIILGMAAFANKSAYSVNLIMDGGYTDPSVAQAWDALAHSRQDCMLFTSVPSDQQQTQQAVAYRTGVLNLNSDRTALYSPDVLVYDPYNNLTLYVPPSGLVAGQVAYSDAVEFPWWSPAGLVRGVIPQALGVRYAYDDGDRALLSPSQVNAIVNFPGQGIVIWDDKTQLAGLSALSFISVRRMVDYVLNTLAAAYKFEVFDPNDSYLAANLIAMANSVLQYVQDNQGLSAFQVISDASNNLPFTLNQGQRIVTLIMTPILPTQNIIIQGVVTAQGASFATVASQLFG